MVMWTDVFQVIVMFLGLIVTLVKGVSDVGGMRAVIEANWNNDRIDLLKYFIALR